jgi:hypothetical protein
VSLCYTISGVSDVNLLVAFYDIHGRKGEVLAISAVESTTTRGNGDGISVKRTLRPGGVTICAGRQELDASSRRSSESARR